MQKTDKPPGLLSKVESVQILLAGIAGSMFAVVWITSFDFIINIFKPDFIRVLSYLRITLACIGLAISAFSGIKGIIRLGKFFIELLEMYNQFKAIKKDGENNK